MNNQILALDGSYYDTKEEAFNMSCLYHGMINWEDLEIVNNEVRLIEPTEEYNGDESDKFLQ
jgi:hypothetical protein